MNDFTSKSSFCVAPWLEYFRMPEGRRNFCCLASPTAEDNSLKTLEETRNSEEFKAARRKMMNGELPAECGACVNSATVRTQKDKVNEAFRHHFRRIAENTAPDGSTSIDPVYIDYRSAACNLTCLTCSPHCSSSWRQTMQKIAPDSPLPPLAGKFHSEEFRRVLRQYRWEKVYFAGGEPLVAPGHLNDLATLAESAEGGHDFHLVYHTNLQRDPAFIERWVKQLSKFKSVLIIVSVDGAGRANDLVRVGSSFERLEKNLAYLQSHLGPGHGLTLHLTVTSVLLATLDSFVDWVLKWRIPLTCGLMFEGKVGRILRIENTRLGFRRELQARWKERYESLSLGDRLLLRELHLLLLSRLEVPEFSPEEKAANLECLGKAPFGSIPAEIRELVTPLL